MAIFVLGYALLMAVYFFIPNIMRNNLLLALVTHNPIIPFMLLYVTVLFSVESSLGFGKLNWPVALLGIAMYWAPSFAWEIARKIRSPEEENEYVTYSRILGRRGAVLVAAGAQTLAFAIGLYFHWTRALSGVSLVIWLIGYSVTMRAHVRFLLSPNPVTSRLRPYAERYIVTILVANLLAFGLLSWIGVT